VTATCRPPPLAYSLWRRRGCAFDRRAHAESAAEVRRALALRLFALFFASGFSLRRFGW
jgi:hypothetical protein